MIAKLKYNPLLILPSLVLIAIMGLFLTNCKKIEPERIIIVATSSFEELTLNSCKVNGSLLDLGENGVSEHGFYLSLSSNLSEAMSPLTLGEATQRGEFSKIAEGLTPGTTYYVWAYASKGGETKYGDPINFTTLSATTPLVESGEILKLTSTSAQLTCNVREDGGAAVTERGICWDKSPEPTKDKYHVEQGNGTGEYTATMNGLTPGETYYARSYAINSVGIAYGADREFTTPQEELPPELSTHDVVDITWNSAVCGATITFEGNGEISEKGICWSLSPNPATTNFKLSSDNPDLSFSLPLINLEPEREYYVRAYAINSAGTGYGDEKVFSTLEPPVAPTVITFDVTNIEHTAASSGGSISSDGGAPVISKGLCWSSSVSEPTLANQHLEYGNGDEPFNMEISDLTQNTRYYVRAYASNEFGTGYGESVEFQTLFLCGSQLVDERDGQTYFTVQIGDQCWMAENLNVGDFVTISTGQSDNSLLEKYCYADLEANCDTYGALYTWDEMMQYTEIESAQGVCPSGWHLPSDYEWKVMERSLGMTLADSDATNWRGSDEGGQLKLAGTTYWNPPNVGASNSSLFTALPAGMIFDAGNSSGIRDFTVYWTSTAFLETQAWYRYLHTDESRILRVDGFRPNTTSVRCVKD